MKKLLCRQASFKTIYLQKDRFVIKMEAFTKDNGMVILDRAMEYSAGMMEQYMKGNG
jgi:hypothetical protein